MSAYTLGMNEKRDLFLGKNNSMVTQVDLNAMREILIQKLSSLTDEFLFNKSEGVIYMATVFESGVKNLPLLRTNMIRVLEETEHVISVPNLQVAWLDDVLVFRALIITEYGNIALASR